MLDPFNGSGTTCVAAKMVVATSVLTCRRITAPSLKSASAKPRLDLTTSLSGVLSDVVLQTSSAVLVCRDGHALLHLLQHRLWEMEQLRLSGHDSTV